jgi:excisionase family DNA binding protein
MENENGFLTITEISEIFPLPRQTIFNWIDKGLLKSYRLGNTKRIKPEDLLIYFKKLGNAPDAMAEFERDIWNFMYKKYGKEEYLKEAKKQDIEYKKYSAERAGFLGKI